MLECRIDLPREALLHYGLSLAHSQDDAEDLVQSTLFKAFRSGEKFDTKEPNITWLKRILKNEYLLKLRTERAAKRPKCGSLADIDVDSALAKDDPLSVFLEMEFVDFFQIAIESLKPEHRQVLVLYYQFQNYEEVAKVLDIPMGTLASRLSRARTALSTHLSKGQE